MDDIIIGDFVILDGEKSAVINGIIGDEYSALDFITRETLGEFKKERIAKAGWHSCIDNAIYQQSKKAKPFIVSKPLTDEELEMFASAPPVTTVEVINIGPPKHVLADLQEYLLAHEDDISAGINDFGSLNRVFSHFIGREPVEG